jgi:hypothetical protein
MKSIPAAHGADPVAGAIGAQVNRVFDRKTISIAGADLRCVIRLSIKCPGQAATRATTEAKNTTIILGLVYAFFMSA